VKELGEGEYGVLLYLIGKVVEAANIHGIKVEGLLGPLVSVRELLE
jgi:hypothetical protein